MKKLILVSLLWAVATLYYSSGPDIKVPVKQTLIVSAAPTFPAIDYLCVAKCRGEGHSQLYCYQLCSY